MTVATSNHPVKSSAYQEIMLLAITHATMTTVDVFACLIGMATTVLNIASLAMMLLGTSCVVARVQKYASLTGMVSTVRDIASPVMI